MQLSKIALLYFCLYILPLAAFGAITEAQKPAPLVPAEQYMDTRQETLKAIAEVRATFELADYPLPPRVSEISAAPKRSDSFRARRNESSCEYVDFREKLGDVRNQDGLGWCFAYVAADLFSAKLGRQVSAIDLSLNYYQSGVADKGGNRYLDLGKNDSVTNFDGGVGLYAMDVAAQRGVCLEEAVKSTDYLQSESINPRSLFGATVAKMTKKEKNDSHWLSSLLQTIESFQDVNSKGALFKQSVCTSMEATKVLFPNLSAQTIFEAMGKSDRKADYLQWLLALSCGDQRQKIPNMRYRSLGLERASTPGPRGYRFLPKVDELLDQEQPVSFSFDPNFVFTGMGENTSLHTALIVGREFRDGKCQYLVRNSFGPSKGNYTRESERGHFWITEEEFHQNALEIGYIQ